MSLENFSAEQIANIERSPGVVHELDSETGKRLHVIEDGVLVADGRGSLAVRVRSLLRGGREDFATRVELWSGDTFASVPSIGAEMATFNIMEPPPLAELGVLHAENKRLAIEDRAQLSYYEAVRYFVTSMHACGETAAADGGRPQGWNAPCVGATFVPDESGSHLASVTMTWPDGASVKIQYSEFRRWGSLWHPSRIRTSATLVFSDQEKTQTSVMVTLIDAVATTEPVPEDAFTWQKYAGRGVNLKSGEIVRADGRTDPVATKRIADAVPPPTGVNPPTGATSEDASPSWMTTWVFVLATSCLVIAGVVWWRRRT